MPRKKISEYRAKTLIYKALDQEYKAFSVELSSYDETALRQQLTKTSRYVVKVDQAVKKRNQLNLVSLDLTYEAVLSELSRLAGLGYQWGLIETFYPHSQESERFLALERVSKGISLSYSVKGGVEVESYSSQIQKCLIDAEVSDGIDLKLEKDVMYILMAIVRLFDATHMTYLEINPLLVENGSVEILDAAVEVDASAEFFINDEWTSHDFRDPKREVHDTERAVDELAATSPSSLSLKVLNPNGSLFLLLSGGGASVVVADEIANLGHHNDMSNYGEYSGNPTEDETYLYTKQVLKLLFNSTSQKKVLLIIGAVANFTDVAKTFKGIMRAIEEQKIEMIAQHVEVFVRRGGPNQKAGLHEMDTFLERIGVKHTVNGPEVSLSEIVHNAIEVIERAEV